MTPQAAQGAAGLGGEAGGATDHLWWGGEGVLGAEENAVDPLGWHDHPLGGDRGGDGAAKGAGEGGLVEALAANLGNLHHLHRQGWQGRIIGVEGAGTPNRQPLPLGLGHIANQAAVSCFYQMGQGLIGGQPAPRMQPRRHRPHPARQGSAER